MNDNSINQNFSNVTVTSSTPTVTEIQFPQKPKRRMNQILLGLLAVFLVVGVAGASYYVSNQLASRQGLALTGPEGSQASGNCQKKGCKSNETCTPSGACKKIVTPAPYSCNSTNCPGPCFSCKDKNTCIAHRNAPGCGDVSETGKVTSTPTPSSINLETCNSSNCDYSCSSCKYDGSSTRCVRDYSKTCVGSGSVTGVNLETCNSTNCPSCYGSCKYQDSSLTCVKNATSTCPLPTSSAPTQTSGSCSPGTCRVFRCNSDETATGQSCGGSAAPNICCVKTVTPTAGGGVAIITPTRSGGGGGGGGGTNPTATPTLTPAATPTPIITGACMEIDLYAKKTDGTFSTTPMTEAERNNIKVGDTIRMAVRANKADLIAKFKITINDEDPIERSSTGYINNTTQLASYYDYVIPKAGNYKFKGYVSTSPAPIMCGGIAGKMCPVGYTCNNPKNVPDSSGTCVPTQAK